MSQELNFSYDQSAIKLGDEFTITENYFKSFGSGDSSFVSDFLSTQEANIALEKLKDGGEIPYQQWHHMPDKKHKLIPLSRLKIAMADTDSNGFTPHYRFPVNSQDQHGVFPFDSSPTVKEIRDKIINQTGIPYNHAVILLYRDGADCIGFHKDKTLDLSSDYPIASVSLGQERSYVLRDQIHNPTMSQEILLSNGSLLLLGPKTNEHFYHSVPMDKENRNLGVRISLTFRVVTTFKNSKTGELKGQGANFLSHNWPPELNGEHVPYYQELLYFWFGSNNEYMSGLWWRGIHPTIESLRTVEKTDLFLKTRWGNILEWYYGKNLNLLNENHLLKSWIDTTDGCVALMILFDQFSRNIYRGTKKSYLFDDYSLSLAKYLLEQKNAELSEPQKFFVYVTMMHSEEPSIVAESVYGILKLANESKTERWKKGLLKTGVVAQDHLNVIKKFGRYPHRNVLLERSSTLEENDFLAQKNNPNWMKLPKTDEILKIDTQNTQQVNTWVESKNKLKILVLHSNRQTGKIFKLKTEKSLEKKLKSIAILTYCDAPAIYKPSGEAKDTVLNNEYENIPNVGYTKTWWNASDDPRTMIYDGLENSLQYIESLFKNEQYDGIIGFSQGGALAGIIAGLVDNYRKGKPVEIILENISRSLQFVAIISGFYCRDTRPEFSKCLLDEIPTEHVPELIKIRSDPINIPSFHVWGTDDKLVDSWRSEKLSTAFSSKNKILYVHSSGHFVKAIKYWPVTKMFDWMKQFLPDEDVQTDYLKECDKILLNLDEKSYDDLLKLARINSLVWKYLIDVDTKYFKEKSNQFEEFRKMLVKLISTELVKEYNDYIVNNTSGFPSKLVTFSPKYNTLYRETRLYHDVAVHMGTLLNINNKETNKIEEDNEKRQLLLCYNQYKKVLSKLGNILNPKGDKPLLKKHVPRDNLATLMEKPLSDYITKPRAEPVDISTPEMLSPLYEYLRHKNTSNFVINADNDIIFTKGTICTDGRLDLCKQVIGPRGISDLINSLNIDSLAPKPVVKHLLLGNNICGNNLGSAIADFIKSGQSALTTWYIAGNDLTTEGIEPICIALQNDKQVRQLWLKRNPLYAAGMYPIVEMLKFNDYLKVLDLTNTGLMDEGAKILFENSLSNLEYLYLSSNGLTNKTCKLIKEKINDTNLVQIGLGCNRLGNEGAKYLSFMLMDNKCKLTTLEIQSCGIGPLGSKYLADSLNINKSLIFLNMGFMKATNDLGEVPNNIGSIGAVYMSEMLNVNTTLRSLDLVYTGIQQSGVHALANVMSTTNSTLLYLNLEQFGVPHNELSRELIRKSLQKNRELIDKKTLNDINSIIDPPHLEEIKSVYRIA